VGHVSSMGKQKNAYKILVGKPEGKRLVGRPSRRWEDNIRMDLRDTGWGGVFGFHKGKKCWQTTSFTRGSNSIRTDLHFTLI